MYAWMLATIAQKCGVDPGEEFRIAVQEANKVCDKKKFLILKISTLPFCATLGHWASQELNGYSTQKGIFTVFDEFISRDLLSFAFRLGARSRQVTGLFPSLSTGHGQP